MFGSNYLVRAEHPRPIDATTHAVLDYLTVGGFLLLGWRLRHHPRAATLACVNAAAVLAASLMTDYPGGAARTLTFEQHGELDVAQAGLCVAGPALLGFAGEAEARPFYAQALLEAAIVSATDFSQASDGGNRDTPSSSAARGETIYRNTPLATDVEPWPIE
jgi:hypothetical protein